MVGRVGRKFSPSARMRDLATILPAALTAWIAGCAYRRPSCVDQYSCGLPGRCSGDPQRLQSVCGFGNDPIHFALIITISLMGVAPHRIGLVALMIGSSLWTALLTPLLGAAAKAVDGNRPLNPPPETVEAPRYSAKQMRARWRRSLSQLSGWQYPLRLTVCPAIAECIAWAPRSVDRTHRHPDNATRAGSDAGPDHPALARNSPRRDGRPRSFGMASACLGRDHAPRVDRCRPSAAQGAKLSSLFSRDDATHPVDAGCGSSTRSRRSLRPRLSNADWLGSRSLCRHRCFAPNGQARCQIMAWFICSASGAASNQ
jgi:hypothetical protein